jgi:hypothetical protein
MATPEVASAGRGVVFYDTSRKPPPEPTWHDILRNGARFPGR